MPIPRVSNKELINCLNSTKKLGIKPNRQEDSTEFLGKLVEEIEEELKNPFNMKWKEKPGLRNLLWANLSEFTVCKECKNENWVSNSGTVVRLEINQQGQSTSTIAGELHKVLYPKDRASDCAQCKRVSTKSVSAPSQELSDYLCLNVPRKIWNDKTNKMERLVHKVKPEKVLNIRADPKKAKSLYSLTGGIIHLGAANSGHYLSIMNVSEVWYEINDAKVKEVTDTEALQSLEGNGVLLIYRRSLAPEESKASKGNIGKKRNPSKANTQGTKSEGRQRMKAVKSNPIDRRHCFRQPKGTNKTFKSRRTQWEKIHIPNGYYDPDKKCYYIPRIQN
jgi:ubiquitin C-terminal hydrolase